MKLKLTVAMPDGGTEDVTVSCDVTVSVSQLARALIRSGAGDPVLRRITREQREPVTLSGRADSTAASVLLDPGAPVGASGLQSGWTVRPTLEFGDGSQPRLIHAAGRIEVLNGPQRGARFSLIPGTNLIGRDPSVRVHLRDASVSRRHAAIEAPYDDAGSFVIRDLGSANRMHVDGSETTEFTCTGLHTITLGNVLLRVVPDRVGRPGEPRPVLDHRYVHRRSPRLEQVFSETKRGLPKPPRLPPRPRLPLIAVIAPALLGIALFAVTRSPMSLVAIVFSPVLALGAWLDQRFGGKRKQRRELREYRASLASERGELKRLQAEESRLRSKEYPDLAEIVDAFEHRTELLWARRPEHAGFLEVRFGDGRLPSRTVLELPDRGECAPAAWEELTSLANEFRDIEPVPVTERLDRCGGLGIAAAAETAGSHLRALILQLAGLHSPAEMLLACFVGERSDQRGDDDWSWLKWLPHVDAASSSIGAPGLAGSAEQSNRLLSALERLLIERRRTRPPPAGGIRVPVVVVVVMDDRGVETARLIELAEVGPELGLYVIWRADRVAGLPAACRTFVEIGRNGARVGFVRSAALVPLSRAESVTATVALRASRMLSAIEDASVRAQDQSDLPSVMGLYELIGLDQACTGAEIADEWRASGSLTTDGGLDAEQGEVNFRAVVGQGKDGPVTLDLRAEGPHALVGGTTGSGKSEFLQTWIMSLAARLSPQRITFLLSNYRKLRQPTSA